MNHKIIGSLERAKANARKLRKLPPRKLENWGQVEAALDEMKLFAPTPEIKTQIEELEALLASVTAHHAGKYH